MNDEAVQNIIIKSFYLMSHLSFKNASNLFTFLFVNSVNIFKLDKQPTQVVKTVLDLVFNIFFLFFSNILEIVFKV